MSVKNSGSPKKRRASPSGEPLAKDKLPREIWESNGNGVDSEEMTSIPMKKQESSSLPPPYVQVSLLSPSEALIPKPPLSAGPKSGGAQESLHNRAHDWQQASIRCDGDRFVDIHGRTLMLRGVNLCGNSKLPTSPPGSTHLSTGFYNHRQVSFVGRPFPLSEADEHFRRLR